MEEDIFILEAVKIQVRFWLAVMPAANGGYFYTVDKAEITPGTDTNFRYSVQITASNSEEKLSFAGSLQFNDKNLIDYLSFEDAG